MSGQFLIPFMPLFFVFIMLFIIFHENKQNSLRIIRKNKRKKRIRMNDIINRYIGKDCLIYISNTSTLEGIIQSVNDNWIVVETKDGAETVNLDYIIRIKEYPLNKNGKKKSIVI